MAVRLIAPPHLSTCCTGHHSAPLDYAHSRARVDLIGWGEKMPGVMSNKSSLIHKNTRDTADHEKVEYKLLQQ